MITTSVKQVQSDLHLLHKGCVTYLTGH